MNKTYLRRAVFFCSSVIFFVYLFPGKSEFKQAISYHRAHIYEEDGKRNDRPDLAYAYEMRKTKDPALGYVPSERRLAAYKQTRSRIKNQQNRLEAAIPEVSWTERGPDNVGGRTRTLVFDPSDPENKKVWAGSVSGGLWYNDDITNISSPWQNVDDFWANLAITSIVFDPADNNIMYVATGEGWFNFDAVRGAGIWKSTDGGNTFTQLTSTDNSIFHYTQKLIVTNDGALMAATRSGSVQRSEDGGATWIRVLNLGNTNRAADLEVAANGDIYASLGIFSSAHIYRSTDNGDNWTDVSPSITSAGRIELAVAPSMSATTATTVLYAVKYNINATGNNDVSWVRRSDNGGSSWTELSIPTDFSSGAHFTRGQAWYDLIMAVHPTNEDIVLMGGIDLYRSADGGDSWTAVSQWFGGNERPYVHADQHAIVFRPGSPDEVIFGNDGGVTYSQNAGSATLPDFAIHNKNYNVTQFYSLAIENTEGSDYFMAGAQDNGVHQFDQSGINSTIDQIGGDGGFVFIDQDNSLIQLAATTGNNFNISLDGGESFSTLTGSNNRGSFINPADYDNDANILYAAGNAGQMERFSGIGGTVSQATVGLSINSEQISAITASPHTSNRIYVGTETGSVYRIDNANGSAIATNISGIVDDESGFVSSIAIGTSDNILLATLSNYGIHSVFYSSNGGTSWTNKDEASFQLSDMPVRWGMFNPNDNSEVLLATEQGVWSTNDITAANPDWTVTVSGLANVRCDMLQYRESDNLVAVATHGRGLYTTDIFTSARADFSAQQQEWVMNTPLQFQDDSYKATSWAWDFDNDGTVDATDRNPTHIYISEGLKTVKLTINDDEGTSMTKTGFINVVSRPEIPYFEGFESNGAAFKSYRISSDEEQKFEWGAGDDTKPNFNPGNNAATISGNNNWMTSLSGTHGTNAKYALEMPSISFFGAEPADYIFSFSYRVATGSDAGMNMEYSLDEGVSWQTLGGIQGVDPRAVQNWYNNSDIIGLSGEDGWTGGSFAVVSAQYNLRDFIGEKDVRLRFVFGSRNASNDGFQIDNVSIFGGIVSAQFTWTGAVDNSWNNGANWAEGDIPQTGANVLIPADAGSFPELDVASIVSYLEIESGASMLIKEGGHITIDSVLNNGNIAVNPNGILQVDILNNENSIVAESGAIFFVENKSVGTGTETVKRIIPGNNRLSILNLGIMEMNVGATNLDFVFYYSEVNDEFSLLSNESIIFDFTPVFVTSAQSDFEVVMQGELNALRYSTGVSFSNDNPFRLIGNPYVAPMSAAQFFAETSNQNSLTGTAWLWNDAGSNVGADRGGDYIAVNSVGTAGGRVDPGNGVPGTRDPGEFSGNFNSMQGFFVEVKATGSIIINQDMVTTDPIANEPFFRTAATGRKLVKLALTGDKVYNDLIVTLDKDATESDDYSMDARKFSGNDHISFYVINNNEQYSISALPLSYKGVEIPLGYRIKTSGEYIISLVDHDYEGNEEPAYLIDNYSGDTYLLEDNVKLKFDLPAGENTDRFAIVFRPNSVTSLPDTSKAGTPRVYGSTDQLQIEYATDKADLAIYDLSGRIVFTQTAVFRDAKTTIKPGINYNQVYLLEINDQIIKFILEK